MKINQKSCSKVMLKAMLLIALTSNVCAVEILQINTTLDIPQSTKEILSFDQVKKEYNAINKDFVHEYLLGLNDMNLESFNLDKNFKNKYKDSIAKYSTITNDFQKLFIQAITDSTSKKIDEMTEENEEKIKEYKQHLIEKTEAIQLLNKKIDDELNVDKDLYKGSNLFQQRGDILKLQYKTDIDNLNKEKKEIEEKINQFKIDHNKKVEKVKDNGQALKNSESNQITERFNQTIKLIENTLKDSRSKTNEDFDKKCEIYKNQIESLQKYIQDNKEAQLRLEEDIQLLKRDNNSLLEDNNSFFNGKKELELKIDYGKQMLQDSDKIINKLNEELSNSQLLYKEIFGELTKKVLESKKLIESNNEKELKFNQLEKELLQYKKSFDTITLDYNTSKRASQQLQDQYEKYEKENKALKAQLNENLNRKPTFFSQDAPNTTDFIFANGAQVTVTPDAQVTSNAQVATQTAATQTAATQTAATGGAQKVSIEAAVEKPMSLLRQLKSDTKSTDVQKIRTDIDRVSQNPMMSALIASKPALKKLSEDIKKAQVSSANAANGSDVQKTALQSEKNIINSLIQSIEKEVLLIGKEFRKNRTIIARAKKGGKKTLRQLRTAQRKMVALMQKPAFLLLTQENILAKRLFVMEQKKNPKLKNIAQNFSQDLGQKIATPTASTNNPVTPQDQVEKDLALKTVDFLSNKKAINTDETDRYKKEIQNRDLKNSFQNQELGNFLQQSINQAILQGKLDRNDVELQGILEQNKKHYSVLSLPNQNESVIIKSNRLYNTIQEQPAA